MTNIELAAMLYELDTLIEKLEAGGLSTEASYIRTVQIMVDEKLNDRLNKE